MTLHDLDTFQFMLVDRVIAEWASFPWALIWIFIVSKVLEDTWPTVNMSAFRNPGNYHLREVFKTYGTLHVSGVYHVEYHLDNISPFYSFIGVIQIEHIIIFSSTSWLYNKFERRLNAVIFQRPVCLLVPSFRPAPSTLWIILSSVRTICWFIFMIRKP